MEGTRIGVLRSLVAPEATDTAIARLFEDALADAQANGYAEADPTLDVDGFDTAHKLAILTALGYGMAINYDDIYIEGISKITPLDIEFAAQFGYRIKLLAITKFDGRSVQARVHPTMIPFDNMLSNVNGTLNAALAVLDEPVSGTPAAEARFTGVPTLLKDLGAGVEGLAQECVTTGDGEVVADGALVGVAAVGRRGQPAADYLAESAQVRNDPVQPLGAFAMHTGSLSRPSSSTRFRSFSASLVKDTSLAP